MALIDYSSISIVMEHAGLVIRGGFEPEAADAVPVLSGDRVARYIVLAGNIGPGMWQAFSDSPEFRDQKPEALDRWSRRVLGDLADALNDELAGDGHCEALFPFEGPPWMPFQRWAQKAEAVFPSPTGPLIHAEYGMWHAYRGALIFSLALTSPLRKRPENPCLSCVDQPCLSTCPVDAFKSDTYDVPSCVDHLASADGADCNELGCRARRACPVGRDFIYEPAQAAFHTRAFYLANRANRDNRHESGS
jgi:hypothetical protein